jgi:hypothetical protein
MLRKLRTTQMKRQSLLLNTLRDRVRRQISLSNLGWKLDMMEGDGSRLQQTHWFTTIHPFKMFSCVAVHASTSQ